MSGSRQPVSKDIVTTLEKFSVEDVVKAKAVSAAAKKLFQDITVFNQLDEKQQAKQVDVLRKSLLNFHNDNELPTVFVRDIHFKKLLCTILISLAEQFPKNEIDSRTSLPIDAATKAFIEKDDQFHSITGQIFSIDFIIDYNRTRLVKEDSQVETTQEKFLLEPNTQQTFLPIDMERLIIIAGKNKKNLDFLIDQPSDAKMGPAELSQGFTLKDLASMSKGKNKIVCVDFIKELKYSQEDALKCMHICTNNNETRTFGYLYGTLTQSSKDILTSADKMAHLNPIIKLQSAQAFICLLANFNEPKTLTRIADLALASGHNVNPAYNGITAFHLAAQFGSIDAIKVLLDPKYNIDINLRGIAGGTAVNVAAVEKQVSIVRVLAGHGANLMIPRYDGIAPIHIAAEHDDVDLMQLLLEHNVNLDQKSGPLNYQQTAAHFAAKSNSKHVIKLLLDAHADFSITNEDGHAPLHLAAYYGSTDVMQVLLQHKDKVSLNQVTACQVPHTVATIAAQKNHVSILTLLAEAKVDLEKPRADDGTTPLHRAVLEGNYEAAAFLIEHCKDIFVKHKYKQCQESAFAMACDLEHWTIAKLFLNKVKEEDMPKDDRELMQSYNKELGLTRSDGELLTTFGLHASSSAGTPSASSEADKNPFLSPPRGR